MFQHKHLDFVEERSFSLEKNLVEGSKEALEKRNWLKFNGLAKECNCSPAIELDSNEYQKRKEKDIFKSYVRGKDIWFDENTTNELLGILASLLCRIETRRAIIEDVKDVEDMGILEEIKEELCGDCVPWLKKIKGLVPTKFSMKDK